MRPTPLAGPCEGDVIVSFTNDNGATATLAPPSGNGAGAVATQAQARDTGRMFCAADVRLLILDDDAAVCRVIQAALASQDFAVEAVSDPTQMEGRLRSGPYQVIILDYVIPGIESDYLLKLIR